MKRATYTNKYGDEIIFEEISSKKIQLTGFDTFRFSNEFIDPSGGPYIQIGSDVGRYFDDKKIRRVDSIGYENKKVILIIK